MLRRSCLFFGALALASTLMACPSDPVDPEPPLDASPDTEVHDDIDATNASEVTDGSDAAADIEDAGPDGAVTPTIGPPVAIVRAQKGEALTPAEVTAFTKTLTGFWKDSDYFRWVRLHSHGVDPSNPGGLMDYALWWQDTRAIKAGDTITYEHFGRADNLTLRTTKVLNNVLSAYLSFGDENARWVAIQYMKGLAALSLVMEFGDDDPVQYLQSRAPFTVDHAYTALGGRKTKVSYEPVRHEDDAWNAAVIHNPNNPIWGDVWYVNQRSKDDLPHMYRTLPLLVRAAAEADDAEVRAAAELALEYLRGFAKDVVDSEYFIRTKYTDGKAVVPLEDNGLEKDLAGLAMFESLIPNAECNGMLASALIGYGATLDNDCEAGSGGQFEPLATQTHFFNYAIIRFFHIAAIANQYLNGELDAAEDLLAGLAVRADQAVYDLEQPHREKAEWQPDVAAFLLASGTVGLPLTNDEAQWIVAAYAESVANYATFDGWDLWADSVADGTIDYMPPRGDSVRPEELANIIEYCASQWRNLDSATFVDCEIVLDPSRWGTGG